MNRLIDAFLELPPLQGAALIAVAVAIVGGLSFILSLVTRHASLPRK